MDPGYPVYPYYSSELDCKEQPIAFPPQHQDRQPGLEWQMHPRPIFENPAYRGSGKLAGRVALITGGDSGIGRAAAVAFAKEGADVAISYLDEERDAAETADVIHRLGRRCLALAGDIRDPEVCRQAVAATVGTLGRLNILVNNAGVQYPKLSLRDISDEQIETTFRVNIIAPLRLARAALAHLKAGDAIINTTSITAYQGQKYLIDYSATKGALVSFTRSLAMSLADQGIRVNAVAPGPVWTPLTVSSFPKEAVKTFGTDTPMHRAAQPFELAPAYVYLASDDSCYVTGEVLHVNGGQYRSS